MMRSSSVMSSSSMVMVTRCMAMHPGPVAGSRLLRAFVFRNRVRANAYPQKQTRLTETVRRVALTDAGVDGGARADRNCQSRRTNLGSEERSSVAAEPGAAHIVAEPVVLAHPAAALVS